MFTNQLPNAPSFSSASLRGFVYQLAKYSVRNAQHKTDWPSVLSSLYQARGRGAFRICWGVESFRHGLWRSASGHLGMFHVHPKSCTTKTTAFYLPLFPDLLDLWNCFGFHESAGFRNKQTIRDFSLRLNRKTKLNTVHQGPLLSRRYASKSLCSLIHQVLCTLTLYSYPGWSADAELAPTNVPMPIPVTVWEFQKILLVGWGAVWI